MLPSPRDLPQQCRLLSMMFDVEPMLEQTPLRSGRIIAKDLGPTLWRARYESVPVNGIEFGEMQGWFASLTSVEPFWGYDRNRQYPALYRKGWGGLMVGGTPFDGTADIVSVNDAKMVALNLLPVGFSLRPGDYLAFDYGAGNASRALHMVVAGGDASAGGALTVEVRPHVRIGWVADASVQLYRPAAKMLILPGTWSAPRDQNRRAAVSFDAIQSL